MSTPPNQTASEQAEPHIDVELGATHIRLLGTAHVSEASRAAVAAAVNSEHYDVIAIELCASRFRALEDENAWQNMDLLRVIREGKAAMVTATLALSAFQHRLAGQFGLEPGAEMRAAIEGAKQHGVKLELIDREIGVTMKRVYRNVPWWQRLYLFSGLISSVLVHEEIEAEDIERLKHGDVLESTFAQFAADAPAIYQPLIEERDQYMAARLAQIAAADNERILAIVGAGHLQGISRHLRAPMAEPAELLRRLSTIASRSRLWGLLPWAIVAVILSGFALGFHRSPELGWSLVIDWVVINGALSALGAAIAGGHVLTIASAFVAAPLTSLNPTVGAGMVTALVEAFVRRPTVGDFARLRDDATSFAGWRRNPVARTLLVFVLSTLGSALGTYIAGFRIGQRLFS